MKTLVTGAAGFVGSHLCERLKSLGHEVAGLDCFTDYYARELKNLNAEDVRAAGVEIREFDLARDPLAAAVEGCEIVYHLAAQPGISDHVPYATYVRNNLDATHRLLDACAKSQALKLFVNVSTSSVYGRHATDGEDAPPKPTSNYGVTKLAAEQLCLAQARERGFPACSLRLFSVYGPRERPEKLYPKLIGSILAGKEFPLFEGSREHSRSFTYVGDILDGFVSVLGRIDACKGEIFNIGSDLEITTGRGIEIVEEILGKKAKAKLVPKRIGDQERTRANIAKARSVLGYAPKVAPEEGLRAEVEWYRDRIFRPAAV